MTDEPRCPSRGRRGAWWRWFLPILTVGLAWTVATPIFGPPDEGAHMVRVVAIGDGQLRGKSRSIGFFGSTSEVRVPGTYRNMMSRGSPCFTKHPRITPRCAERTEVDRKVRPAFTVAGRYPPLYYVLVALPTRVFGPPGSVYAVRVLSLVICAAFLACAFDSAQSLGRWALVGVTAATTPMALYLSSVVNPSGLEIASAMALWTSAAALAVGPRLDARFVGRAALAYAFFANARTLSVPMAMAAVALPLALAERDRLRCIARSRSAAAWGVMMVASTIVALAWTVLLGRVRAADLSRRFTVADGLVRSWRVFEESVASFGLGEVRVVATIVLWALLWALVIGTGLRLATRRDRLVLGAGVLVSIWLPITVSLVHPPPIYTAWQGRYSIPLWIGVPILSGAIAARSEQPLGRVAPFTWTALVGSFTLGQVLAFAAAAHRYAVGIDGPAIYFLHARWAGPVPPLLVLSVAAAGLGALAWQANGPPPARYPFATRRPGRSA